MPDEQGSIVKKSGTIEDIDDRKLEEWQSWALIDAIPQQIWSGPADGTLDYCNERWRSYMGLELEDLRGNGWQTMLHPDDQDRVLKAWRDSVLNGTPYEQEERHRAADGAYRWFLARGVPLRDAQGRIVRWYGTNTDIEDRKQAEDARTGTTCLLDLPKDDIVLDQQLATALFRILQETLTNVARHANATRVTVRLAKEDGSLTLDVHDNGKGISDNQLSAGSSLGILGMRERALLLGGELTISGSPGQGSTVRVRTPWRPPHHVHKASFQTETP